MKKLLIGIILVTFLIVPAGLSLIHQQGFLSAIQPKTSIQESNKLNTPSLLNNTLPQVDVPPKEPSNSFEEFNSTADTLENLTRIRVNHHYTTTGLIGNFTGSNEYEYVKKDYDNSTLVFYNITSGKPYAIYNETYSTDYYSFMALTTAQLDLDTYDELVYLNSSGYLYFIDNNLNTLDIVQVVSTADLYRWNPYPYMKVADLDNNGIDDFVLALEDSSYEYILIVNGTTRSVIASFNTTDPIGWYTIGNFNQSQGLEIAVSFYNRSVVVYSNSLTRLTNTTFTYNSASTIATYSNTQWNYDALILLFTNNTNNFDIYNATTFQSMSYNDTIDNFYGREPVVGDLTGDSINEIIFPISFPDGYGMAIYDLNFHRIVDKVKLISIDDNIRTIRIGKITADNRYDILFVSQQDVLVFKGTNDPDTDIQFVRKIDEPSWITNAFIAQYKGGLNDIFVDSDWYLYVYPTDSTPPRIKNLLPNPLRPTIEDGMFYLSAEVYDESDFDNPTIIYNFTTFEGVTTTTGETTRMMKESHTGNQYTSYFFGINAGIYTYKIIVRDIYDNQKVYDNNGTLYNVTVYSSKIYSAKVQDSIGGARYAMAVGNLDNDMYSDVVVAGVTNITVVWGNNTRTIGLTYTGISFPTVYLGSFDAIAGDDVVFVFYNDSAAKYQVNVYHGSTFTLLQNYSFASNITMVKIGDLTNDGLSELIIVEESLVAPELNNLYIIDVSNNETLKTYMNLPKIHHMLIANISNDEYLDLALLLISENTYTFNLTVIAGGSTSATISMLYSYNETYTGITISDDFLFFDNFLSYTEKQFLIVIDTYSPYLYLVNGANGTLIDPSNIPYDYIAYSTALTVIDSDYDGLKELAYLGYDKSLTAVSLVNGYLYSIPTDLSSIPFASYWVNMDEDSHNDLVYILPTGTFIFSPYNNRLDSVTYPFKPLASTGVGNFFQLPFSDFCLLTADGVLEKYININTFYRLTIDVQIANDTIPQGDYIDAAVTIRNVFNDTITTASVLGVFEFGTTVIQVSSFISLENGTYLLTQTLTNLPMGVYSLRVDVSEPYYGSFNTLRNFTLLGEIVPYTNVYSSEDINEPVYVNVTLFDQYGFPVFNANVTAEFANDTYLPIEISQNSYFFALNKADLKVGEYTIRFNATHKYAVNLVSFESSVTIITRPKVEFAGNGITQPPVTQGQPMNLKVTLRDATNHTLTGGTITAYFFGKIYTFSDLGNGTYVTSIITQNIPGGKHLLTVEVTHPYLVSEVFVGNITVYGAPEMNFLINPVIVTQNSNMTINITLVDAYGYPITGANVTITFLRQNYRAENVRDNIYQVTIPIGDVHFGYKEGFISVQAKYHHSLKKSFSVFVYPEVPRLNLTPSALLTLLGISIFVSFIGLGLYYYISSKLTGSFAFDEQGRLVMSFKSLDLAYMVFIGTLLLTLAASEVLYLLKAYELSVATLGLALLEILLLHGIWLYRDTATSLIKEQLPIKRMFIGLWHLILAPLVILLIFAWARNIDWFAYYLLEDITNIGGFRLPSLYISLMGTYVTSVIVLTVNIYLNSRRYVKRFSEMRVGGTPETVINDEKLIQLDRMSSSIRLKFLIFLGILGASIVSTATPLLQFYQLGVVVIIPLVVVVVIPYLISQLLKFLGIAKRITKKLTTPVMNSQGPSSNS